MSYMRFKLKTQLTTVFTIHMYVYVHTCTFTFQYPVSTLKLSSAYYTFADQCMLMCACVPPGNPSSSGSALCGGAGPDWLSYQGGVVLSTEV